MIRAELFALGIAVLGILLDNVEDTFAELHPIKGSGTNKHLFFLIEFFLFFFSFHYHF